VAKPLPSIFIDTYFHPDQPTERAKFAQNTHKLLTFAQSVQPFECKDIEIALHEIREMQNNMNKLKSESEEKTKIMQQLIEERHALETRLERLEAGVGAAATPPMSDRREAGIFCSNNKSVFFFLRTWMIYFTSSKPVLCGYETVRLGAGGYKEMSSFLADQ